MAPFEELQELWQRQPELPAARFADVKRSLGAYGRRQNWINGAKALAMGLLLGVSAWAVRTSAASLAGIVLVTIAAGLLLARDWRSQRALARGDFAAPSLGFVHTAIERLLEQRNVGRSYYWGLIAACIVGENLILAGSHKIWLRVFASLAPFAGLEFGLWVRRRRFDWECRPLLDQLRAIQSDLEERA
jgi:hypothetical protein